MGEPVTEDALDAVVMACNAGHRFKADAVLRLVAEVRRLRAAQSTWLGLAEADAAGYARAERDVVAWLRQRADDMGDGRDELSRDEAVSQGTVYVASDNIEQGAHRGAAKEGM